MKKFFSVALLALFAIGAHAEEKDSVNKNKPVFTTIKENKITSIKDQNRSGTCWAYSTLAYFESEILKKTGKTYDLCEAFVANKTYMDRAIQVVRLHGDCQFSQGGSCYDPLYCLQHYGICPEDAMPFPGSLYGDSLNNFNEFFGVMEPYVAAIAKSTEKKISSQWKVGLQGILDAYLGHCPEKFTYQGKEYTPKTFAASLGLNMSDYVELTSFTHHPYYEAFEVEVPDNWEHAKMYNLPLDELIEVTDHALQNGYTVCWDGDVSEKGFSFKNGVAINPEVKKVDDYSTTDRARFEKMDEKERLEEVYKFEKPFPEVKVTPEIRQEGYEAFVTTDDHLMHLTGIAKDQNGTKYYITKNSWGTERNTFGGYLNMSESFVRAKTIYIMIHKDALPKSLRAKLGVK